MKMFFTYPDCLRRWILPVILSSGPLLFAATGVGLRSIPQCAALIAGLATFVLLYGGLSHFLLNHGYDTLESDLRWAVYLKAACACVLGTFAAAFHAMNFVMGALLSGLLLLLSLAPDIIASLGVVAFLGFECDGFFSSARSSSAQGFGSNTSSFLIYPATLIGGALLSASTGIFFYPGAVLLKRFCFTRVSTV